MALAARALLASVRSLYSKDQPPITIDTLAADSEALRLDVPVYVCIFPEGKVHRMMTADRVFRSPIATSRGSMALVFAGRALRDYRGNPRRVVRTQFFGWNARPMHELDACPVLHIMDFLPLPTFQDEVQRPHITHHEGGDPSWRVLGRIIRQYNPVTTHISTSTEVAEIVPGLMRIAYTRQQDLLIVTLECAPRHVPDGAPAFVADHRWVGTLCVDARWLHRPSRSSPDPPRQLRFPSLQIPEEDVDPRPPSKRRRTVVLSQSDEAGLTDLVDACFQRITAREHLFGVRVMQHGLEPGPPIMVTPGPSGFRELLGAFVFAPTSLAVEVCKTQYGTVPGTLLAVLDLRIATAADLDRCFAHGWPTMVVVVNTQREGSLRLARGTSPLRPLLDRAYRDPLLRGIVFCFDDSECAPTAVGTAWLWALLGAMLGLPEGEMFAPHALHLPRLFELCPPTVVGADPISWCASHPARGTCLRLPELVLSDTATLKQLHDAVVASAGGVAARFTTTRPIVVLHMGNWQPAGIYQYDDRDVPWRLPRGWVITQTAQQLWNLQNRSSTRITGVVLCQRAAEVRPPLSTTVSILLWRHRPDYMLSAIIKHPSMLQ